MTTRQHSLSMYHNLKAADVRVRNQETGIRKKGMKVSILLLS